MNIINLGILAHIDAGKTSVTENLLFACGATEKRGSVDKGDTITDSMDIEKRRGITIRASTTSIVWNGVKCNIIDTPGHMDFIAEVERTFKMLDGAVLILSAKEGIQAQTKLLFKTLQKLQIPTIIFINKIDRAGVNLERLYLDIKTNLSQDVLFMQTVVDGVVYPICTPTDIRAEHKEFVCNHDDDILELYLADKEILPADYWNAIIALVAKAKAYPVLHGSAMCNIGINELLDAIISFIFPPASVPNRLSAYLLFLNMENFFKLYYQYKRKVDALFMVVVGIVLFFLFWFLPPASSAWDKIMYGTGYVCAALSFVCGLLFLFGLVPHNIQKSYDKAEQIVNDSEKLKQIEKRPAISALQNTLTFFIPVIAIVILGCIIWEYSWWNIGYLALFMAVYYIYKFIKEK